VELQVPAFLVEPLFGLVERLFGRFPYDRVEPLVQVWLLRPRLAGYHFGRPVFYRATDDNRPLDIDDLITGESISQGHLTLYPVGSCYVGSRWYADESLFNHTLVKGTKSWGRTNKYATPVAVIHRGETVAGVTICGPACIEAVDHDPVDVPAGYWVAVHPFPSPSGDVD
jgi:hypothetical protein